MKITGNMILDRLEVLKRRSKKAETTFTARLTYFKSTLAEGEQPKDPRTELDTWANLENQVIRLQELQVRYNLDTPVSINGSKMTLELAVKYSGVVGRLTAKWTAAGADSSASNYRYGSTRNKDNEYPVNVIPLEEAQEKVEEMENLALKVKQAIRAGNSQEREYGGIDDLFTD